jgi:large subunit ribosomal protein L18
MGVEKLKGRHRRKKRVQKKIRGTSERPRLTVFRSGKHIYAQVIDDAKGVTLVSASTLEKGQGQAGGNKANATEVGKRVGQRAKEAKIDSVIFDRNGYLFHGSVKALADAAREAGLRF